jgi:hypothetical protein
MNFNEKVNFIKSNYYLIKLNFNNNLNLDIYYSPKEDVIYIVDIVKNEILEFYIFSDFSDYLNNNYKFELEFKEKYSDIIPFYTRYLRHNLCLNEPFLLKIGEYKKIYLERFNFLFDVNISPYEEITDEDIKQINKVMQNVIDKDYLKIHNYEIPLLVFLGEYFIYKHNIKWEYKKATNDFGNNFTIPIMHLNSREFEISNKLNRYLNHPRLRYKYDNFSFKSLLGLDFIYIQTVFKFKN